VYGVDTLDQGVPAPATRPTPRRHKVEDCHGRGPAMLSRKRHSSLAGGRNQVKQRPAEGFQGKARAAPTA
jgi:hypothetical protein